MHKDAKRLDQSADTWMDRSFGQTLRGLLEPLIKLYMTHVDVGRTLEDALADQVGRLLAVGQLAAEGVTRQTRLQLLGRTREGRGCMQNIQRRRERGRG